jgi:predicted DNA-binding protein (MmcQ/YjbR family)
MADVRRQLVEAALRYPGAFEDFPWGERVAKVNKKIFAFFGADDGERSGMTVKLPTSCDFALSFEGTASSGYGLGRAGWVSVDFARPGCPDAEMLLDWIDESYRSIAPKRLVEELEHAKDSSPCQVGRLHN